MMKTQNSKRV